MKRGEGGLAALLALVTVAAAGIFAFAFTGTSLWLDEAYSVLLAGSGVGGILGYLRSDLGPPLYYLLLAGWSALFGDGERAVRALSGVAYLVTCGVLGWGGWVLTGSRSTAVLAAALCACSALAVRHAMSARMYALLGLWVALATVLWLLAHRRPSRRLEWAAATVSTLGLFTQYWFGFVMLAQFAVELTLLRPRPTLRALAVRYGVPGAVFGALWGPVLLQQLRSGGSSWIDPVGPSALVATFLDFYGSWIAVAAFVTFAGLILIGRARATDRASDREVFALYAVCVLSVLVPFVISWAKPIYLVGRYTLVALPPFALATAVLLARWTPRAGLTAALLLVVVRLLATSGDQLRWAQRDAVASSRTAAARLESEAAAEAQVVFTGLGGLTLRHYLTGRTDLALHTFPGSLAEHPGWLDSEREAARPQSANEARALVASLPREAEVWHVYERDDPLAAIVVAVLEAERGPPSRRLELPGSFHDTATVYPPQ